MVQINFDVGQPAPTDTAIPAILQQGFQPTYDGVPLGPGTINPSLPFGAFAPVSGSTVVNGVYTAPASVNSSSTSDALAILQEQLDAWGLDSLLPTASGLLQSGLGSDAVLVQLEQSDAFKQRFAGNTVRQQNGLAVLSPADYLSTEESYDQVLRQYGIDSTFATQANYANWIGQNVSSTELQTRAQEGATLVQQSDPTARNLLNQWYGVTNSDLLATFLDPTQAQSTLDKKSFAANVGASMQQYLGSADQTQAEGLYGSVTQQQAQSGLQQAGATFGKTQALAERYGAQYTSQDAINQYVLGQQGPADLQQNLSQQEEAQFSKGSGFSSQGAGTSAGSF